LAAAGAGAGAGAAAAGIGAALGAAAGAGAAVWAAAIDAKAPAISATSSLFMVFFLEVVTARVGNGLRNGNTTPNTLNQNYFI
jgi:hypothetical protein